MPIKRSLSENGVTKMKSGSVTERLPPNTTQEELLRKDEIKKKEEGRKKLEIKNDRRKNLFNKLKVVHISNPSIFSSTSGFVNYRGIVNLCFLLLVLSNFRVALNNILKYGLLVDLNFVFIFLEHPYSWPSATLVLVSNIFIQICYHIERQLSKDGISERIGQCLHAMNLCALVLLPIYVVFTFHPQPWFSTLALMWYTQLALKLSSYQAVNWWCREEKYSKRLKDAELKPPGPVIYPNNINQRDLYYFMLAPTFCYELNFPRTKKIRMRFLIRRCFEALFLFGLIFALIQQWIVPLVKNSLKPFKELELVRFFERMVKLAVPNHLLWLMGFYAYFHSFLNIVAELIYFSDRTFYKDWWNAPNVTQFWQNWNIPIHRWGKRHIYEPMLRNDYSKIQASLAVFCLSAFFHEFVISIPLRMFRPYAFVSMMMQVPLAIVTSYLKNPWGNIAMWLSLIIGQPLAIMMYYHDYLVEHNIQLK